MRGGGLTPRAQTLCSAARAPSPVAVSPSAQLLGLAVLGSVILVHEARAGRGRARPSRHVFWFETAPHVSDVRGI